MVNYKQMKNIESPTKQTRTGGGVLIFLLLVLALSAAVTFAYFTGSFKVKGESTFGNVDVSFSDAEKEITNSNFASVFMPEALVPGAPIDFSELRVKNESNTDIYTLLEFTATITNPDSSQVKTYTSWYNLAGEKVNIANIDKEASKILKGESGQAETLTYQVPIEIDNTYKNGKLKIDITTHAVQGRFGTTVGYEPLYASYLIIKNKNGESITSPVVDLTLVIDNATQTYRVKKNDTLQNAILETNTTANDYNSCGWFDDNEFLEVSELSNAITTNRTVYTKTASPLDTFCFMYNNDSNGEYYSVGGRLINGTTYLPSTTSYDRNDYNTCNPDPNISGDVVFPCRFKNDDGLDLPVTMLHMLTNGSNYGGAFVYCKNLTSVTFSASITKLDGKLFFYNAGPHTSISIHNKITFTSYDTTPFIASNFTEYKVSPNNPVLSTLCDGKLLTNKEKTLVYTPVSAMQDFVFPEGIKTINYACWQLNNYNKHVTFASSIEELESWAFGTCKKLESVTIPRDSCLTTIGSTAFIRNYELRSFYVTSLVNYIGQEAFEDCSKLKVVTIDSPTIYNALTGTDLNTCGGLIQYAETINVLKSVVDDYNNTNTFLNDTTKYTRTTTTIDGYEYYQYKKVA